MRRGVLVVDEIRVVNTGFLDNRHRFPRISVSIARRSVESAGYNIVRNTWLEGCGLFASNNDSSTSYCGKDLQFLHHSQYVTYLIKIWSFFKSVVRHWFFFFFFVINHRRSVDNFVTAIKVHRQSSNKRSSIVSFAAWKEQRVEHGG